MGSPSNRAAREAQAAEDARMAAIRGTQQQVNAVFDSPERQADIQQFVADLRGLNMADLDKNKMLADRSLKFALARNGQVGGSTQIDRQERLGEDYQRGVLEVDRAALGAGASLQAADQDARARLISLATSGLDATTGAAQSAAALRSNIEGARANAKVQGLDQMFGSVADFAKQSREAKQRQQGLTDSGFSPYGSGGYGG